MNVFHVVNRAIKQQYCNTVRPQLNTDCFTQHMISQTWRLRRFLLKDSFVFNTLYKHFYNLKLLYSSYLSEILLYKKNFFLLPMSFNEFKSAFLHCHQYFPLQFLPYLENILKSAPEVERRFCEDKLIRTKVNGNRIEPPSSIDHQVKMP